VRLVLGLGIPIPPPLPGTTTGGIDWTVVGFILLVGLSFFLGWAFGKEPPHERKRCCRDDGGNEPPSSPPPGGIPEIPDEVPRWLELAVAERLRQVRKKTDAYLGGFES
jgi:hypothetical protein